LRGVHFCNFLAGPAWPRRGRADDAAGGLRQHVQEARRLLPGRRPAARAAARPRAHPRRRTARRAVSSVCQPAVYGARPQLCADHRRPPVPPARPGLLVRPPVSRQPDLQRRDLRHARH